MSKERIVVVVFWAGLVAGLLWYVRDALVGMFVLSLLVFCPPHKGRVVESWQSSDGPLALRIDVHEERCGGFVPGVYLCYWSRSSSSSAWSLFMELRHDDPIAPPADQVRVASETVAYCYFSSDFASTSDGGKTWHRWNVHSSRPYDPDVFAGTIEHVAVDPDGKRVMAVSWHGTKGDIRLRLTTNDFGAAWAVDPSDDAQLAHAAERAQRDRSFCP